MGRILLHIRGTFSDADRDRKKLESLGYRVDIAETAGEFMVYGEYVHKDPSYAGFVTKMIENGKGDTAGSLHGTARS